MEETYPQSIPSALIQYLETYKNLGLEMTIIRNRIPDEDVTEYRLAIYLHPKNGLIKDAGPFVIRFIEKQRKSL